MRRPFQPRLNYQNEKRRRKQQTQSYRRYISGSLMDWITRQDRSLCVGTYHSYDRPLRTVTGYRMDDLGSNPGRNKEFCPYHRVHAELLNQGQKLCFVHRCGQLHEKETSWRLWNTKNDYRTYTSRHWALSWARWIQSAPHILLIKCILALSCHLYLGLLFRLSWLKFRKHLSSFPCVLYVPHIYHPWSEHPNSTWWIQFTKQPGVRRTVFCITQPNLLIWHDTGMYYEDPHYAIFSSLRFSLS
jgi:hypothetical protein